VNPLSDWSVDAEAVAERQQRLLDSTGYAQPRSGGPSTTSSLCAPRRWACWLNHLRKLVTTAAVPGRPATLRLPAAGPLGSMLTTIRREPGAEEADFFPVGVDCASARSTRQREADPTAEGEHDE
jgi:hypothetical protein